MSAVRRTEPRRTAAGTVGSASSSEFRHVGGMGQRLLRWGGAGIFQERSQRTYRPRLEPGIAGGVFIRGGALTRLQIACTGGRRIQPYKCFTPDTPHVLRASGPLAKNVRLNIVEVLLADRHYSSSRKSRPSTPSVR